MRTVLLALLLCAPVAAQEPLLNIGKWLPEGVADFQVSPDGAFLLVRPHYYEDSERALELWNVREGKRVAELHPAAQHISARFSPDGQQVAAIIEKADARGNYGSAGWLWDLSGKPVGKPVAVAGDFSEQVSPPAPDTLAFTQWENHEKGNSDGGNRWAEGKVQLWHLPTSKVRTLGKVRSRLESSSLSSDGRWLVSAGGDGQLRVWDTRKGGQLAQKSVGEGYAVLGTGSVIVSGRRFGLPGLAAAGSLGQGFRGVHASKTSYRLAAQPQRLNPQTLRSLGRARLSAAPRFSWQAARAVGSLSDQRVVLWDVEHRASAVIAP